MHCALPSPPAVTEWNVLTANNSMHSAADKTIPLLPGGGGDFGGLSAVYV